MTGGNASLTEHVLVERIPCDLQRRWRDASVLWGRLLVGAVTGFFVPIAVAVVWLPFRQASGTSQLVLLLLAASLFLVAWSAVVYLIGSFIRNGWSKSKLPVVELCGDRLTVHWHGETIEADISDCNLRQGPAWQMKYAARKASGLPLGDGRDLILIDFPPLYRDFRGCIRAYTTVAVGYTDESLEIWTVALDVDFRSTHE